MVTEKRTTTTFGCGFALLIVLSFAAIVFAAVTHG